MSVDAIVNVIGRNMKNKRIMTLSDPRALSRVTEFISTQCLPLDIIMGGGVPVGRLTEIYGDTSTGKSLLATHILASVQTMGGIAQLIDTENATSIEVMEIVGVKIDELLYSTPDTVEEVYADMVDAIEAKMQVDKDMPMVIVWDSIAMTSAQDEIDRVTKEGLNTKSMGVHARLISQMCRIVPRMAKRSNVALIFINQSKSRFGVMFGDNVATFGGKSVPFYSSVRLELKHIRKTKGVDGFNGIEVRARVAKNKIAPPFGVCEIPVLFGIGMDEPGAILWQLKKSKLVTGGSYKHIVLNDKDHSFREREWPEFFDEHEDAVREFLWSQGFDVELDDEDAENI